MNYTYASFGSTEKSYLYAEQRGRCLICLRETLIEDLHVDHDHSTGYVRGLLCPKCNQGLGMFDDNTASLRRAIQYLQVSGSGRKKLPGLLKRPESEKEERISLFNKMDNAKRRKILRRLIDEKMGVTVS